MYLILVFDIYSLTGLLKMLLQVTFNNVITCAIMLLQAAVSYFVACMELTVTCNSCNCYFYYRWLKCTVWGRRTTYRSGSQSHWPMNCLLPPPKSCRCTISSLEGTCKSRKIKKMQVNVESKKCYNIWCISLEMYTKLCITYHSNYNRVPDKKDFFLCPQGAGNDWDEADRS